MENFSYHVPVYVVDTALYTAGHSNDMAAKQVGIFNRANFNVSTAGGTDKEVFFAQAPNGGKDWYGFPVTGSHKSPFFLYSEVEDLYASLPQTIQNEEWILGYNGAVGSVGLSFSKGTAVRVKFLFTGEPTYRFFGGPKEYLVSHTPTEDCTVPCDTGDCTANAISDPIVEAKKLIDKINNNTELRKFGVKAYLVFAAATAEGGTVNGVRTMKITLKRKADGSDRLAEFAAWVGGVDGVNIGALAKIAGAGTTTAGVSDEYTITQNSYDLTGVTFGLSNQVTFQYAQLPAIEGVAWIQTSEVDPADTAAATPVAGRPVGIRVTAGYLDPKFGDCSFDPKDYYETMPVKFEISQLNESEDRCDVSKWPSVLQTKVGQIARQSGEWVVREVLMKSEAYLNHMNQFSLDSREREAFDQRLLSTVDRTAYYKLYYVRFKASYGNTSFRKNTARERFTAVFAIKSTDSTTDTSFNTNIIGVIQTRTGLTMHTNS